MNKNLLGLNILNSDIDIYDLDYGTYYFEDILIRLIIYRNCIKFSKITKEKETEEVYIDYKLNYNRFDMYNYIFSDTKDYTVKNFFEKWSNCDLEIINVYKRKYKTSCIFNPFLRPKKVDFNKRLNSRKLSNGILTGQLANCKYVVHYTDDYYNDSKENFMKGKEYPIGKLAKELIQENSFKCIDIKENKVYLNNSCTTLVLDLVN